MPKKHSTIVNAILFALNELNELDKIAPMLLASPYQKSRWLRYGKNYNSYRNTVYNLRKRGSIQLISKDGKKFLKLTKKGQLEILLAKAILPVAGKWDGKWRMIIFDIPESAKPHRNRLRWLLKKNNFRKLQASVYVSPNPLNREAIEYLRQSGLSAYIRIIKVEEMDNDEDLKKKFSIA